MVKCLRHAGEDVLVLDNFENGHRGALLGASCVEADLRNPTSIENALAGLDVEAVFHFAAYTDVGESERNPAAYYENNVVGSWNLLEACVQTGVKAFVFSSTAAVYGEPVSLPITEDHPLMPTNTYGSTKIAVERMIQAYSRTFGFRHVCLRYFNACGADPEGELGEDHLPETHIVPRLIKHIQGKSGFKVFGDDYETPDGTCIRDYVHVSDLAEAHLLALQYMRNGAGSDAFNLGSGSGHSVREVVDSVLRVTGSRIDVSVAPRRPGDPARLVASSERAQDVLGWRPRHTALDDMVSHAWNWMKAHPDGYGD
ncbi:MAG: UDP-glucose 4-epimerase GalE [Armatimonadetes bacterium]|nr:UDP-glucose 4-epimerase GalE [Armatimonadota bacterium]